MTEPQNSNREEIALRMQQEWFDNEIAQMEATNRGMGPCKQCGQLPYPAMDTGDYWDWDHDALFDHPYLPLDK